MAIVPVLETLHEIAARAAARDPAAEAFDPAASPLHRRAVFLLGAPRSGTTWLHQLLATHPQLATGGESHVFCEGLGQLLVNHADPDPYMYLSTWLPRAQLVGLVRAAADGVLGAALTGRPGATHVLDKTPNHTPYAATLAEVYPDAAFVHIVRDARDSVSSAHDLWASWSEQARVFAASAAAWREAVLDCREHLAGLRYLEVRYEDLLADPDKGLRAVLDHLDLPYDDGYVASAVEFGRAPINVRPSDPRLGARKWVDMDPAAEREVVAVAGELMVQLGYLTDAERAAVLARRARPRRAGARPWSRRRTPAGSAAAVRDVGDRLSTAASAGDLAAVAALFGPEVTADLDGVAVTADPMVTARRLVDAYAGGRVAAVDADPVAVAVQVVTADGGRRIHRYWVRAGRVHRILVQGG